MTTRAHPRATGGICSTCTHHFGLEAGVACGCLRPERHIRSLMCTAKSWTGSSSARSLVGTLLHAANEHPDADYLAPGLSQGEWYVEVWSEGRAKVVRPRELVAA